MGSAFRFFKSVSNSGIKTEHDFIDNSSTQYHDYWASNLVSLVFFIILFVGVQQKNIVLVKIYKYFLVITGILTEIFLVWYLVDMIFIEEKTGSSTTIIVTLLIALAITTGLFLLFLWIVNGVIGYIENEKRLEEANENTTNTKDQKIMVTYEAV